MRQIYLRFKTATERRLNWIVGAVIAVQPLLDVLSFFLQEWGSNLLSTALRFLMLAGVALLGFLVSDRKRVYLLFYGAVALFWVAHVANCLRLGYQSPFSDARAYFAILNFPVFALSFITFFRKGQKVDRAVFWGFGVNMAVMALFTILPWALGDPQYTYPTLYIGVMGWFAVENAQSTILALASSLAVYGAYRTGKYPVFLASLALCFTMLFLTGTKFTFYSLFIIAGGFAFLFALNLGKRCLRYTLPLVAVLVLAAALRDFSPMQLREDQYAYALGLNQETVEQALRDSGSSVDSVNKLKEDLKKEEEEEEEEPQDARRERERQLAQLRAALYSVYTGSEGYGGDLENLCDRFGLYNVMEAYDYTSSPGVLSDWRLMKNKFAQMMWEEKDLGTHLLGSEAQDMVHNGENFDLENDFPAVFYSCGYVGFGLYVAFILYFLWGALWAFARQVAACWGQLANKPLALRALQALGQGLRQFLTVEMGAVGMTFLLAVGSGLISGNTLRRPNVTVYFAVSAGYLCYLTAKWGRAGGLPAQKK